jgi:hypothetical protein
MLQASMTKRWFEHRQVSAHSAALPHSNIEGVLGVVLMV